VDAGVMPLVSGSGGRKSLATGGEHCCHSVSKGPSNMNGTASLG